MTVGFVPLYDLSNNILKNTWQNLYRTSYQPKTPIKVRGPKVRDLILVDG